MSPIPSTGSVSLTNIEAEYGKLSDRPSSVSEYSRATTSTPSGAEGISLTGPVSFSNFRGKIAHPDARECIRILERGISQHPFGGTPVGSVYNVPRNTNRSFNLAASKSAVDNDDGRFSLTSNYGTQASTAVGSSGFLGTKGAEAEQNTVIFVALGKANGLGALRSTTVNASPIVPQYFPATVDTGWGTLPVGAYPSFNHTMKVSIAVYTTPPGRGLTHTYVSSHTQPENFRGYGGGDTDSHSHAAGYLLPNKWSVVSSSLKPVSGGTMGLEYCDIALVCWAGNDMTGYPGILKETNAQGTSLVNNGAQILRIHQSQLSARGYSCISLYANTTIGSQRTFGLGPVSHGATSVANASNPGWRAHVTILRMVGDGYLSSLTGDIAYT